MKCLLVKLHHDTSGEYVPVKEMHDNNCPATTKTLYDCNCDWEYQRDKGRASFTKVVAIAQARELAKILDVPCLV